jgi:hypothetical protein
MRLSDDMSMVIVASGGFGCVEMGGDRANEVHCSRCEGVLYQRGRGNR